MKTVRLKNRPSGKQNLAKKTEICLDPNLDEPKLQLKIWPICDTNLDFHEQRIVTKSCIRSQSFTSGNSRPLAPYEPGLYIATNNTPLENTIKMTRMMMWMMLMMTTVIMTMMMKTVFKKIMLILCFEAR